MKVLRCLFGILLLPICVQAAQPTILVIESYHADYPWDKAYRRVLRNELGARYKLEFFEMNTKRLPVNKHAGMGEKAMARVHALKPALVMMGDDPALKYVGQMLDQTGIPGVYFGINNNPRNYGNGSFKNITGVLERPLLKRSVAYIRQLMPATRKVLVLFDDSLTATVTREEIFGNQNSVQVSDIQVDIQLCNTVAEWKKAISEAHSKGYQATVAGLYQTLKTPEGTIADENEMIHWASANTRVPLFAFWDFVVGANKAIGGLVLSGAEQGKAAADIARIILEGKTKPQSIFPITAPQGDFVFSRKQLQRFRLTLPEDMRENVRLID